MQFNNIDFTQYFKVLAIKKPLVPNVIAYDKRLENKDGAYYLKDSELDALEIDVKIELINKTTKTNAEYFREVAGKLYTANEAKLIFKNENNKYYMAKLVGNTDNQKIGRFGIVELTFRATVPLAISTIEKTIALNTTFTNLGTYKTYGIITIKPTANANELVVTSGGKTLKLIYAFSGTESILIDLQKQFITMNGSSAMKYLTLDSDFFDIGVGSNKITVNGTGNITLRECWL